MTYDINKIRARILDITDPSVDYTQADFDKEFGNVSTTATQGFTKLQCKFVNTSSNQDPEYATAESAGFDVRANLTTPYVLKSGEFTLIKTGLFFEIPKNFEIQIRPRSGLAFKHGITVLNSPGTIDSDYRGELGILLINHGKEDFTINHGDRIAQAIIASVITSNVMELTRVDELTSTTERGNGGFGHSGLK